MSLTNFTLSYRDVEDLHSGPNFKTHRRTATRYSSRDKATHRASNGAMNLLVVDRPPTLKVGSTTSISFGANSSLFILRSASLRASHAFSASTVTARRVVRTSNILQRSKLLSIIAA